VVSGEVNGKGGEGIGDPLKANEDREVGAKEETEENGEGDLNSVEGEKSEDTAGVDGGDGGSGAKTPEPKPFFRGVSKPLKDGVSMDVCPTRHPTENPFDPGGTFAA